MLKNFKIDHTQTISKNFLIKNNELSKINAIDYYFHLYIDNVPDNEIPEMFNQGFLPDFWQIKFHDKENLKWKNIRSTRLNLKDKSFNDFKPNHYNNRMNKIKKENIIFCDSKSPTIPLSEIESQINNVWLAYCDYKDFKNENEFENFKFNNDLFRYFFVINPNNRLEAFSITYQNENLMYIIEQCWNYLTPKLSLLRFLLFHKIRLCIESKMDFLYLGEGYFENCLYKSEFPYFEWWTGQEWSNDIEKYNSLCKLDSKINSY